MFAVNFERNEKLGRLWQENVPAPDAGRRLGIPRSTAYYYYGKFKKYAQKGEPLPVPPGKETPAEIARDIALKMEVDTLKKEGKFADAKARIELEQTERRAGIDFNTFNQRMNSVITDIVPPMILRELEDKRWEILPGSGQAAYRLQSTFNPMIISYLEKNGGKVLVEGNQLQLMGKSV